MPQITYDDWEWWSGSGAQSAAEKEYDALQAEGQGALAEVMGRWLTGDCKSSESELIEKDLWELKTRVGNNQYRILFCIRARTCWVLTAFYKNQQQVPPKYKLRARRRRKTLR